MAIKLGDKVRDVLTGFTGIAIGRHQYLTGCSKITIEPQEMKDGKPVDSQWFDEQRVEVLEAGKLVFDNGKTPGGPERDPTRSLSMQR